MQASETEMIVGRQIRDAPLIRVLWYRANRNTKANARSPPIGVNQNIAQRNMLMELNTRIIDSRPNTTLFCACVSSSSSASFAPKRLNAYAGA